MSFGMPFSPYRGDCACSIRYFKAQADTIRLNEDFYLLRPCSDLASFSEALCLGWRFSASRPTLGSKRIPQNQTICFLILDHGIKQPQQRCNPGKLAAVLGHMLLKFCVGQNTFIPCVSNLVRVLG